MWRGKVAHARGPACDRGGRGNCGYPLERGGAGVLSEQLMGLQSYRNMMRSHATHFVVGFVMLKLKKGVEE